MRRPTSLARSPLYLAIMAIMAVLCQWVAGPKRG